MDVALSVSSWQFAIVYPRATVVAFRSAALHMDHVKHVSTLSRDTGVALKLNKGSFFLKKSTS